MSYLVILIYIYTTKGSGVTFGIHLTKCLKGKTVTEVEDYNLDVKVKI